MKWSPPLYGTFLFWLLTNILLVVWAAFFFFPERYGVGWNVLLTSSARDRLQILAERLAADVGPVVSRELKVDLERYEQKHGMQFGIYGGDGRQFAGSVTPLPRQVIGELRRTEVLMLAAGQVLCGAI